MLGPPPEAAACGTLLLAAERLLADHDPAHLREAMQTLAENAFERERLRFAGLIRRQPMTQSLARALGRQYRGFHAGLRRELVAARLRVPSRESRFTAAQVPQLIPLAWYDRQLQQFACQLTVPSCANAKHVRRAAALKLVEMTAGGTWADCAKLLDMPIGYARTSVSLLRERCPRPVLGNLPIGSRSHRSRVGTEHDPARLRPQAPAPRPMDHPGYHWSELTRGLHNSLTQPRHRKACSVIAWTRATEGEHLFNPLIRADGHGERLPDGGKLVLDVNQLLNTHRGGLQTLRERLEPYAEQLAAWCDTQADHDSQ